MLIRKCDFRWKNSYLPLQHNVYLKYFSKKVGLKKKKLEKFFLKIFRYPSDKITITRAPMKIFARNLAETCKIRNN